MHVSVELEPQFVGRGAADTSVENSTTLALASLLVKHDAIQARAQNVLLAGHLPHRPLRNVLPAAEVPLHRVVQFAVVPEGVGTCLSIGNHIVAAGRLEFDAGFRISGNDGEIAGWSP